MGMDGLGGLICPLAGAASDKVAALDKAGVIVTDSPAKIGVEILGVRPVSAPWRVVVVLTRSKRP